MTRVIATSSSDAKLARALQMGASDGINYKTAPEWGNRARELTLRVEQFPTGIGIADHGVFVRL